MTGVLKFITWPTIAGLLAALLILERLAPVTGDQSGYRDTELASYSAAVNAASPSVVNIYTRTLVRQARNPALNDSLFRGFAPDNPQHQRVEESLGSGVIMSAKGHILTNNHVISGADAIWVLLQDGRSANARVVGTDEATDLAVLQVELPNLQPIVAGNSDTIHVGDVVLAIGNPFGLNSAE